MKEKIEAHDLKETSGFLKWLDNFWYHYKWQTIFVLFFALVLTVSVVQCSNNEQGDLVIGYAGNYDMLNTTERDALIRLFGDTLQEDLDGNGKKAAELASFSIYNEEQLVAAFTRINPETGLEEFSKEGYMSAKGHNTDRIKNLQTYIMTGDCAVWLVSPYVYETMFLEKYPVTETLALKDTAFYAYYDVLKCLPEDTMVILTKPILGNMSDPKNWKGAEAYFQAIKSFADPG